MQQPYQESDKGAISHSRSPSVNGHKDRFSTVLPVLPHPELWIGDYLARFAGPLGFSRVVAAKRLHPHLVDDEDFKGMFLDEARLAARIRHPNVVPTLDVLVNDREIIR